MIEVTMDIFFRFLGICAVLHAFGIAYSYLIARKPFQPKLTWLSVVIGDGVTDIGMSALILLLTGNLFLALIPEICHILTGGPMILGQATKHTIQNSGTIIIDEEEELDGDGA